MSSSKAQPDPKARIEGILADFPRHREVLTNFMSQLAAAFTDEALMKLVPSIKYRVKDADHLEDKLQRKLAACKNPNDFPYTTDNYISTINDLVGVRLLHLHTHQFRQIDPELRRVLDTYSLVILEGPTAKTWDDESREFFTECGATCERSDTLYTSVHYTIKANLKTPYTAEIQVRTLSEEVWGEVNHKINYPHASDSLPCREQIKALARLTSSVTRLVDSIFASHEDAGKSSS